MTQQLRELEGYGLVHRKVYAQVPPKVEYSLTPLGQTLKPVIDAMHAWAETHGQGIKLKRGSRAAARGQGDPPLAPRGL